LTKVDGTSVVRLTGVKLSVFDGSIPHDIAELELRPDPGLLKLCLRNGRERDQDKPLKVRLRY
jgi:hypothetical protein